MSTEPNTVEAIQWTGKNIDAMKAFDPAIDLGDESDTVAIDGDTGEPLQLPVGCWVIREADGSLIGCSDAEFDKVFEAAMP